MVNMVKRTGVKSRVTFSLEEGCGGWRRRRLEYRQGNCTVNKSITESEEKEVG